MAVVVAAFLEDDHHRWGRGGTGIIERLYDSSVIYIPLPRDVDHG